MGSEQDSRHLIEVRQAGTKGQGIFAIADIPRGTRVLAEEGLLQTNHAKMKARDVIRAFPNSPEDRRRSYLSLHAYAHSQSREASERDLGQDWGTLSPQHRQVIEIWAANSFGDVYLIGSRFNHSCFPNMNYSWNTNLGKLTFHAARDIAAGEELTITYVHVTNRMCEQRQEELQNWGFVCACPVCDTSAPDFEAKDKVRATVFNHGQMLAFSTRIKNWEQALKSATALAALQSREGVCHRELRYSFLDAARACVLLQDKIQLALLWAEKALDHDRYCVGEDHPDYAKELDFVEKLRTVVERKVPVEQSVIDRLDSEDGGCVVM